MGMIENIENIAYRSWLLSVHVVGSLAKDISISAFEEFCESSLHCREHEGFKKNISEQ